MVRLWWQLPGPSQFISQIAQDLRDGKNVVLCIPDHLPDGLDSALRSELVEDWDWHTLCVRDEDKVEPVHLLFERFVGEINSYDLRDVRTLAQNENFAGKIIWLDGLTPENWPTWRNFLLDYENPCRAIPQFYRTLFCVPLVGEIALNPLREDVCLSHKHWEGVVKRLDMLLFVSNCFQGKQLSDLQKRVAIAVITNLALWDYSVSERLADERIENILNPISILKEIAEERNWDSHCRYSIENKWCKGMLDTIDGETKTHSAFLAIDISGKTEIERRIWSAELGEVLPFIEERRLEILEKLTTILKVPFQTSFGVIEDIYDLEIGHINSQIKNNRFVNHEIRELVQNLKEIRNSLSHLQSIDPKLLLCREINDWYRILRR